MITNVQFSGPVSANSSSTWRLPGWPANQHVIWYVVPTSPQTGGTPQLDWDVVVARESDAFCTYWVTVRNLTSGQVGVEGRFAILNV